MLFDEGGVAHAIALGMRRDRCALVHALARGFERGFGFSDAFDRGFFFRLQLHAGGRELWPA